MSRFLLASLLFASTSALAVPLQFTHQGRLSDSTGVPLQGAQNLTFSIHPTPSGPDVLWSEQYTVVVEDGYFSIDLGSGTNPIDSASFDGSTLYLGMERDGQPLGGRLPIVSVPYAVRSGVTTDLDGGSVDASEVRINGTLVIDSNGQITTDALPTGAGDTLADLGCTEAGSVAQFDGLDWTCVAGAADHSHAASDITTGQLDIARIPVGTGDSEVASGSHSHDFSALTGTVDASQLPGDLRDGTTIGGAAVAAANHTHAPGDAATLQGKAASAFATSSHSHDPGDAATLQGQAASAFASASHGHKFSELTGAAVIGQLPVGTSSTTVARGDHTHAPEAVDTSGKALKVCSGSTKKGSTGWQNYSSNGIVVTVDISGCGFSSTPNIVSSMSGTTSHWTMTGASMVYNPNKNSFRIFINGINDSATAEARQYAINWIATGN